MDVPTFGRRTAGARGDLPQEWQVLLASQAATLAALLARMQTAAAPLRQRQPLAAWWQAWAAEAERVLTVQAQEHVSLERALGYLRALAMDCSTTPSALGARVRSVESAIEVWHANLAIVRQYLTTWFAGVQEPWRP